MSGALAGLAHSYPRQAASPHPGRAIWRPRATWSPSPGVTVTAYQPHHAEGVIDVLASLLGTSYPGALGGRTRTEMSAWLHMYPTATRWVALDGTGRVTGHVQLGPVPPGDPFATLVAGSLHGAPAAEVARLFVRQDARRDGAGAALLAAAVDCARGAGQVPVLRVSDFLQPATALYRAAGWTELGTVASSLAPGLLTVFALLP